MTISNQNGRAFEYILCTVFKEIKPTITFTERAKIEQQKDYIFFNSISTDKQETYRSSAKQIVSWVVNEYPKVFCANFIELDRLPDSAGVKGDVTDIRFKSNNQYFNISLKNNHKAFKHPRLTRVPSWIGITDLNITKRYLREYNSIWEGVIKNINPSFSNFEELGNISNNFIDENIYNPLCSLVTRFLNENINDTNQVCALFQFMVGTQGFIKIIDYPKHIEVYDFYSIPTPTAVQITQTANSYIDLNFNNSWILSMRLHTASSKISKSVKFDVQGRHVPIKGLKLPK